MAFQNTVPECLKCATATLSVAVAFFLSTLLPTAGWAQGVEPPVLEAELLIAKDDIRRLSNGKDLSPAHEAGLRARVRGAIGVLPWLLIQAGDEDAARTLQALATTLEKDGAWETLVLGRALDEAVESHPLDDGSYDFKTLTATERRTGKALHDMYCPASS